MNGERTIKRSSFIVLDIIKFDKAKNIKRKKENMFLLLLISLASAKMVFVSDYFKAVSKSTGVDYSKYGMEMPIYTVVENNVCTSTGGTIFGFSVGDFNFDKNVKAVKFVAKEAGGKTTVTISTFSDEKCATQKQITEMLSLDDVKTKFKFEYKDYDSMKFAYSTTAPDKSDCSNKNNILKNYVTTGCISFKTPKDLVNTTYVPQYKMSIKIEKDSHKITSTFYQTNEKCEGQGVTGPVNCNVCVKTTMSDCIKAVEMAEQTLSMYPENIRETMKKQYEKMKEECRTMGDYAQYIECEGVQTGNKDPSSSMSTFILAVLVLLVFLF